MRLGSKLIAALLVTALVPLGIATWEIVRRSVDELEASAREYHLATADLALAAARELVDGAASELSSIGAALAQPDVSVDDRMRAARAQLLGATRVDVVAVYAPGGTLIDTMRAGGREATLPTPPTLPEEVLGAAKEEGRALLGVARGASGAPAVPLVVPVYRGQERSLYAFVWTAVDLAPLSEAVARLSERRFGGRPERVRILDAALRVLAASDHALWFAPAAGAGAAQGLSSSHAVTAHDAAQVREYDAEGEPMLGALVPLPRLGWAVVVEEPQAEAYASARETLRTSLWVGGAFALLAVVLGLLLGRRMAAPVSAVAQAAGRVAGGDFSVRVEARGRDEVGQMAAAFNHMAGDLSDYRDRLVDETRARENLSRFLSPDVVDAVVEQREALTLGGEVREVTVLFADVVGFTPLTEEHDPQFVVGILNELFTIVTEIVFRHGGTVDKFIGDCVMAVFGAPYDHDDDPARAVRAAEEILRWMEVGNAKWRGQLGRDLELAIGINTGPAVAGNVGSDRRMDYTVIGDAVNVAARLESIARPGQILMTRATMDRLGDEFDADAMGAHQLTGRKQQSEIFTLLD